MNKNKVLIWLKDFKYTWLSQHILNDTHLIELISTKLHELEQLLTIQDHHDENEITLESEDECTETNNTESIVLPAEQHSLCTPPNIQNDKTIDSTRPAIRIKRIPLAEAKNFLPPEWQTPKSKRSRKKSRKNLLSIYSKRKKPKRNTATNKPSSSSTIQDETAAKSNDGTRRSTRSKKPPRSASVTSATNIQSMNDEKKRSKRKLRAIDAEDDDLFILGNLSQTENSNGNTDCNQVSRYLGQNGILSQTRRTNETTTYDDDFTIKLHSRQSNQEKTKCSNNTTMTEPVCLDEDIGPIDDEQMLENMLENHDTDSLFTSLEITHDKTLGTSPISNNNSILNYDDCIEDITNDGIDPPPSSSSPNLDHISLIT